MKIVRYGLIGFGAHAEQCYAEFILKQKLVKNATIAAVTEPSPKRRKIIPTILPKSVKVFTDYHQMLDHKYIDAAIITSPHPFHAEMVIECLKRNIPVMCEKPAATTAYDVKRMIEASKKSKALFGMMFNQRALNIYQKMRSMIKQGELGDLQRINWVITMWYRPDKYYTVAPNRATWKGEGGGLIINQACHQIDLLQWIMGEKPVSVNGFLDNGKWHPIEADDDFTLFFRFKNGATGTFISTTGEYPGCNRLEISGTKGKLVCEGGKLTFYQSNVDTKKFSRTAKGPYDKPGFKVKEIKIAKDNLEEHMKIMTNFTNAILGKEKLLIHGSEGLKAVEIINASLYSGWHKGITVKIPVNETVYLKELKNKINKSKFLK
ncbi:MAG: Gfo/Idh/MocA family oxidoreductase [Bacilli bacterium]|nr:Gfo/Idh/MocA family oxidoreductase [Bacilli bacterium]